MRNAEATRERILDAALTEFSAHGIAGARVDRIAATAGCNKNLIYIYFENKETLFATVLRKHLTGAYEEHPFSPEDLTGYALQVFDQAMAHPELMRLLAWYSLEQSAATIPERLASQNSKLAALAKSQKSGGLSAAFPPAFLLTAVMALATAWSAASPYGQLDLESPKRLTALRRNLARAVAALVESD